MNKMENVTIFEHPLIQHKISILRDNRTGTNEFRQLVDEIAMLEGFVALSDLPVEDVEVETLDLKKENVNLEERYFKIVASKTAAGIRTAPISEKVYPFFEYWYNLNDCEYLLSTPEGEHFKYRNYYDSYWSPLIETLGMKHRPHDTRHTCISMLTVAGVSDKVIKKIVGHKGHGVTEVVYTHFEIEELIDAINKI